MESKETIFGKIPNNWGVERAKDILDTCTDYVANGSFKSLADNVEYKDKEDFAVLIRLTDYNNDFRGNFIYVDKHSYDFLAKSKLEGGEIIISNVGANVGTVFKCPYLKKPMTLGPNAITVKFKGNNEFYFQWLRSSTGQQMLRSIVTGSAQPKFNKTNFKELYLPVPPMDIQNKIANILRKIDERIELGKKINTNLEEEAFTIFKQMFPDYRNEIKQVGDYIIPSRGKNLLSKNFVDGDCPVVAGGLEPAGFHNSANTKSPVITISSSGANSGFVALWNVDVWSSDSSFIDSSMTEDVYFWYVMLKIRQQEIYDSQTGSAQPHIYPQHIARLPICDLSKEEITEYNNMVKPLFLRKAINLQENIKLKKLRDTLLPKLMSGEIDVTDLDI